MLLLPHIKLDDIQVNDIYYIAASHYVSISTIMKIESNKSSKAVILFMQMSTSLQKVTI